MSEKLRGRVTIPTDVDVVPETLELVKRWGADAIRDCDGTDYPAELRDVDAKVYSTYYTTRKDNAWATDATTGITLIPASFQRLIYFSGEPAPVVTTGTFSSATSSATSFA